MASTAKIKLGFGFADDSSRDLEFVFDTDATIASAANLKAAIQNFDPAQIQGFYISENSATCTGVSSAVITKLTETDIPLHAAD